MRDGDTAEVITDAEANANTNTALTVKATCTGPQRSNRLQFTYRLQHLSQRNFKFFFSFGRVHFLKTIAAKMLTSFSHNTTHFWPAKLYMHILTHFGNQ